MRNFFLYATSLALLASGSLAWISSAGSAPQSSGGSQDTLREQAEQLHRAGSYAKARELFERALATSEDLEQRRWLEFRVADSTWRAEAASDHADTTPSDDARRRLEELIQGRDRPDQRDRVWLEIQESLGDFHWRRRQSQNWGAGWPYYQRAFEAWSRSPDIELARERYLDLLWRVTEPPNRGYYNSWLPGVPINIIDGALEIAQSPEDRSHAHFLAARMLVQQGGGPLPGRVGREFEATLQGGRESDWYDDALAHYAQWLAQTGPIVTAEDGSRYRQQDFRRALELYRRLVTEFKKGESPYYDQARRAIEEITGPQLGVSVGGAFWPNSPVRFHCSWRNVERVDFRLVPVELTRDLRFRDGDHSVSSWLERIELSGLEPLESWTFATEDDGEHRPGSHELEVRGEPAAGAYVLEARAGGLTRRELVLIGESALVLKTSEDKAWAWCTRAGNGHPLPEASVRLWERYYDNKRWRWRSYEGTSDAHGLATFDLRPSTSSREYFVAMVSANEQAFCPSYGSHYGDGGRDWRAYVYTDRPAYRPGDQAHWKMVLRASDDGVWRVPDDTQVRYEIHDPRGTRVAEGELKVNRFGSADGALELGAAWPLGEYTIDLRAGGHGLGRTQLFRLEEYKLPEFRVTVRTPEEDGKRLAFKSGDTVEVEVGVEYYFGGAVAEADAEVLIHRTPYWPRFVEPREFPWYYESQAAYGHYYGGGQTVLRETHKTDAQGKVQVSFPTQLHDNDFEYRVEVRVIDSSRREVTGSGTVRVTRQRYYVHLRPEHRLYRPGDEVEVELRAQDANGQPVQTEGLVRVKRVRSREIWLDADGREVPAARLRERRARRDFPPEGWVLSEVRERYDEILERGVATDAEGKARIRVQAESEGLYTVQWTSRDRDGASIHGSTSVWVCTEGSRTLGYRHGGMEIVLDKDTFRTGETAAFMLVAPSNDRYVLLTLEGDDYIDVRVVHLEGDVKLVRQPIDERHVPNVFVQAMMVSDGQVWADQEEVIVPPLERFLDVELQAGSDEVEPGAEDVLTVVTRDANGEPVSAEVSLALVDESVYAIQEDYALDPRQFFYGVKRTRRSRDQSSVWQRAFVQLRPKEEGQVGKKDGRYYRKEGRDADFESDDFYLGRGARSRQAMPSSAMNQETRLQALGYASDSVVAAEMAAPSGAGGGGPLGEPAPDSPQVPQVIVRSDFRVTALWEPSVITAADGTARVDVRYPDSLTSWRAIVRAVDDGSRFGTARSATRSRLPLQVRLQAPRFFVVGDRCVLSAIVNNNSSETLRVEPLLAAEGLSLVGDGVGGVFELAPGAERRLDWWALAQGAGSAKLRVEVRAESYGDAVERSYPVYEHGIEKLLARAGHLSAEDEAIELAFELPPARRGTSLSLQVTPSVAVTMLDALPYLIRYPYGCVEQTMSRFLPAAITARTLRELGLSEEDIAGKMFGGIEPQHADATHTVEPSLAELDKVVASSLERLIDFQHSDGGWGWWKHGESDSFMSAYVLWGLTLAHEAGMDVSADVADRAARFLSLELVDAERQTDLQAWMLHAVSVYAASRDGFDRGHALAAADNLWEKRRDLNAYTRALFALATHHLGQSERAATLVQNLENGARLDAAPGQSAVQRGGDQDAGEPATAHWGSDGIGWRWSSGKVEATAFCLRALVTIDPQHRLIAPVTRWLVQNRRGAQWSNTRDTAIAVLALNDYLRASGELEADLDYEITLNGTVVGNGTVRSEDVLGAPSVFALDAELLRQENNVLRIVRTRGTGALYASLNANYFSLEEPIEAAGTQLFVRRQYNRSTPVETLLAGTVYETTGWVEGESVTSGDRMEVVLTVEAKNDLEYVVLEDLKPAGLEATEVKSGRGGTLRELKSGALERTLASGGREHAPEDWTGRQRWVHMELRDRKVALFIDKLPQGVWEIRYELRAEVPGEFHALPVMGHAMYVPEIRCNGREVRMNVLDR